MPISRHPRGSFRPDDHRCVPPLYPLADAHQSDRLDRHQQARFVTITPLPNGMFPADFGNRTDLRLRHETFQAGNGYTGAAAADDTSYVEELLADLVRGWRDGTDYIGD